MFLKPTFHFKKELNRKKTLTKNCRSLLNFFGIRSFWDIEHRRNRRFIQLSTNRVIKYNTCLLVIMLQVFIYEYMSRKKIFVIPIYDSFVFAYDRWPRRIVWQRMLNFLLKLFCLFSLFF